MVKASEQIILFYNLDDILNILKDFWFQCCMLNLYFITAVMTTLRIDCKIFINLNKMCIGLVFADYICYTAAAQQ